MRYSTLSKEKADVLDYASPLCEELSLDPQSIICESDTEGVDEEDGEW